MVTINRNICVAPVPGVEGVYGYDPSLGWGVVFSVLFGLSMASHLFSTVRNRRWWQVTFAIGALLECIGWAGRTWSSKCPYQTQPFLMQITTLIIAPAFFTAGTYIVLGRLITSFGGDVSPLRPAAYLYIFCTADLISLVVQAIGGGMAASRYAQTPPGDTTIATNIMVAGIVFQLFAIVVFSVLFALVIVRALKTHSPLLNTLKMKWLIAAIVFSVTCVVIRSIYRTIELLQGWTGYLITHEVYFIALDGWMMILAVAVFNFVSPGWAIVDNVGDRYGQKIGEGGHAAEFQMEEQQNIERREIV